MKELFFSKKLRDKLQKIKTSSVTIVEAPAGYGKTTAIQNVLSTVNTEHIYWYTAFDGMVDYSFSWLFGKLANYDTTMNTAFDQVDIMTRSNAKQIAEKFAAIHCQEEVYFIIDNFQFIVSGWQPQVISALANRKPDGMHFIFITQYLGRLRSAMDRNKHICRIHSWDLVLNEEGIREYANKLNVEIKPKEVQEISEYTHGWAVAVSLLLMNMKKNKDTTKLQDTVNTDLLLFDLFWNRLKDNQQKILLQLCLFDNHSKESIADVILEKRDKAESLNSIYFFLRSLPLIEYSKETERFVPHIILLSFLRNQLEMAPESFRKQVYQTAGKWYQSHNRMKDAVQCFFHIRDYEGILSCNLSGLLMEKFEGVFYREVVTCIAKECPKTILEKNVVSGLKVCYALYASTQFDLYSQLDAMLYEIIKEKNDTQLLGEWQLVHAFSYFPDVEKMKDCYLEAAAQMTKPSDIFTTEEPFMFGCTSMWYLFYSKQGEMQKAAQQLEETLLIYDKLTNNHSKGAVELYKGEVYCVRGEYDKADGMACKAFQLAKENQNVSVIYGVSLLLGINAVYQSDMEGLKKAIDLLEEQASFFTQKGSSALNQYMVETVRAYLLALTMETGKLVQWSQGEADEFQNLTFTNFMVKTTRITDLMIHKEYKRAIASVENSLTLDSRLISLPTKNFMHVGLTLCYLAIGKIQKAAEYLDIALTLTEQDRNFTFLASFRKYLMPLFILPTIAGKHATAIKQIKALKIHYTKMEGKEIFSMLEPEEDLLDYLTPREREVAKLAARGMHNKEISTKLHITEETVKGYMKTIFQKLNIDRRGKLTELFK